MNTMKNTLQLHLENFQAISDMDLAFDEGINIIAGQSNSSKTSILRAIEVLLRNQSGSAYFIKYGEKECLVNMKYLGNDITWSRTKKDIVYEINGEKYLKVGNTDIFHLLERNGFVIDPQDELSNLEDEWTLPFPFYKSSSELFKLFENIFSVSDSAKILKAMKEDEDSCKKQLLEVENELNRTKRKIEAISELHIEDTVQELAKYKEQLTVLNRDKEDLLDSIHHKLIVSCQARKGWAMYGADIMAAFAKAAEEGGAAGIRATGVDNITKIKEKVKLPIIGINKQFGDYPVYITPTYESAKEILKFGITFIYRMKQVLNTI